MERPRQYKVNMMLKYFSNYSNIMFSSRASIQQGYTEALQSSTREDFFSKVKEADPKNYVLYYENLEYFAEKHYAPKRGAYSAPFTDFIRVLLNMRAWVEHELPNTDRPKTLVIWGPSRTGKTSWARSLGSHTYIGYQWSVRELDLEATYIVVDNIEMSNFKLWQPFIGK